MLVNDQSITLELLNCKSTLIKQLEQRQDVHVNFNWNETLISKGCTVGRILRGDRSRNLPRGVIGNSHRRIWKCILVKDIEKGFHHCKLIASLQTSLEEMFSASLLQNIYSWPFPSTIFMKIDSIQFHL